MLARRMAAEFKGQIKNVQGGIGNRELLRQLARRILRNTCIEKADTQSLYRQFFAEIIWTSRI